MTATVLPERHTSAATPTPSATRLSVWDLQRRAAALLPSIRSGAEVRERERTLPFDPIARIAQEKLYTFRIPQAWGGSGSTVREVMSFVMDLAAADSNIAQALRPGYLLIENLLANPDKALQQRWFARYLAGDVIANAGWELGGANGVIASRIERQGAHYRANGKKYYSTGALYADWITIAALDENGQERRFALPRGREGLELLDDFDAMGQRLTASGTTVLNNALVYEEDFVPAPVNQADGPKRTIVTPFAQLFLAAVEAGIARNALEDATHFAQHHARPIKHSSATRSVDDPYVAHAVGEIAAQAFAAKAAVLHAADSIDAAWANQLEESAIVQAAVDVAQAQYIAVAAALQAAERVFDVGGASATSRQHNLDRHWRNARTVANHNPRDWKAAVVGQHFLTRAQPPLSGLF